MSDEKATTGSAAEGGTNGTAAESGTTGTAAESGATGSAAAAAGDKTATTQGAAEVVLEAGSLPLPATVGRTGPEVTDVRTGMFGVRGSGDTSGFGGLVRTVTRPGPSAGPYGSWFDDLLAILAEVLGEAGIPFEAAVEGVVVHRGELTLEVAREHLVAVCRALRDDQDLRFELGLGVSGVHYPHETGRELHAVYHLTSVTHGRRLRLEVAVPDADPHIPSTTSVYPGHDWHERETYDFFGIVFDGHPALARIEMPDDWVGHPQRKDYPLGGIPVEYKGASVAPADERRSYS